MSKKVAKGYMFNCQMCGQCILHSTGMTCPMNCPKNLRNGPCGGVREDGHCEVIPERPCIWVQAWERSQKGIYAHEISDIQPPVNRALQGFICLDQHGRRHRYEAACRMGVGIGTVKRVNDRTRIAPRLGGSPRISFIQLC